MRCPESKRGRCLCWSGVVLCVIGLIVWISLASKRKCTDGSFPKAAVAADSETCSKVGRDMLQRGGSAVDGAIAALLCTSVVNPQSMGLGGGAIFTVMDCSGNVTIISSRETVPKSFKSDLLQKCDTKSGPDWIGEGVKVSPVLGEYIKYINENISLSLYQLFSDSNGEPLKAGDIVKFEKLADTLEVIAKNGPNAFYSGKIAEDLISDIQQAGGTMTLQDLASFRATQSAPWVFNFEEFKAYIPPPPAGGAILALVLNIMKGFKLDPKSMKPEEKTMAYHRYIEAFKFANGLKKHIKDPMASSDKTAEKFIQDSFADHIRSLITNRTHEPQHYNPSSYQDSMGTTHMSVLAEDGSAVSVTSTINMIFGSNVFSEKTGIILNNELADFCERVEEIHAGERPPSNAAPTVFKSKSKTLVIGASGGGFITTGIASTLMNHLWFGKSLQEAVDTPVVYVNSVNHRSLKCHLIRE
ncbi:hypothetical protein WMY93_004815 [Mugilogobius chulae]|uniref:Gamma-glutamyltransferase 5 n=1 Tax=Mugilogobius chulae TaxID=88201 RepID=A0AAW0PY45_9GOBI